MNRILKLKTGQEYAVVGEDGKYYICEDGTTFRKLSPDIAEIRKIKQKKEEKWEDIPADDPAMKQIDRNVKKPVQKKTKKGE